MRPIKFRAWDFFNGEYFDSMGDDLAAFFREVADLKAGGNKVAVEEFTGLHDDNGREIYEGDIVKGFDSGFPDPRPMKIEWRDEPYAAWFMVSADGLRPHMMCPPHGEVIGTIHENPELVK